MKSEIDICATCKHSKSDHTRHFSPEDTSCVHNWPNDSWFPDENTCRCPKYVD